VIAATHATSSAAYDVQHTSTSPTTPASTPVATSSATSAGDRAGELPLDVAEIAARAWRTFRRIHDPDRE
jgi:hypothetical protein